MMFILITWIIRFVISIIAGFASKSMYDSKRPDSEYYSGKRFIIYHSSNFFLIWLIPVFGWIFILYLKYRHKNRNIFFNE